MSQQDPQRLNFASETSEPHGRLIKRFLGILRRLLHLDVGSLLEEELADLGPSSVGGSMKGAFSTVGLLIERHFDFVDKEFDYLKLSLVHSSKKHEVIRVLCQSPENLHVPASTVLSPERMLL